MSEAEAREPIEGDGYAVANLGGLGEGYGFRAPAGAPSEVPDA